MVDTTTDVHFPAHPCRDVLVGFTGVLDVPGSVEHSGGHLHSKKGPCPGVLRHCRTWESHKTSMFLPSTLTPQIERIQLKIVYIKAQGDMQLGDNPICNQQW